MRAVQGRHQEIKQIERTLMVVAQLIIDLAAHVDVHQAVVEQVNQQSEVVQENVGQANVQLNGAIKSARAANRKKWWCLGIARLSLPLNIVGRHTDSGVSTYHYHHRHHCCRRRQSCGKVIAEGIQRKLHAFMGRHTPGFVAVIVNSMESLPRSQSSGLRYLPASPKSSFRGTVG